jgi:hypothetical protein
MLNSHYGRAGRGVLVGLVLLVAVGLAGCDRGGESSGPIRGPSGYQPFDAAGDRVLVRGSDGEVDLKIRRRQRGYKVYGADLIAQGFVYEPDWTSSNEQGDGGAEGSAVRVRPMEASAPETIGRGASGGWGLGERFRVEQTGRGLAVFGAEADWLGRFEHDADRGWRLVRGSDRERVWSVERDGPSLRLVSDGEVKLTVDETDMPGEVLLALGLEELSPLERVALGVWLRHEAPSG